MSVKQILLKHNVRSVDDLDTTIQYGSELFEDLYSYYLNSGEMPYGIAKARTGDPFDWVYDKAIRSLDG